MTDFVLVRHENGIIAPVARAFAERRQLDIVEGDAVRPNGKPVRPVRENGRAVKPKRNLPKASGASSSEKAVTPTEGAADSTLTNPKE